MEKKYFFFDIDGTLTDDATHLIVPSALKCLYALMENGHFVSIASGRAHYKTVAFTDPLGLKNIVCCGGGCLVIDGKVIENRPLEKEKAVHILEEAEKRGIGWVLMLDDSDRVYLKDYRFLEQAGLRTELTTYCCQPDLDYHSCENIFKIYAAVDQDMEKDNPWIHDLGHIRMGRYLNFQHDDKKTGIERMLAAAGGRKKDAVVFGDGMNDLVMFDPQWTSIAMGNGKEELKKKADYVTAANVDDGIAKACLHYGWISEKQYSDAVKK